MSSRLLIVNADDFGQSPGINRGITRANDEGIVTSASLMVCWDAAAEAAAWARERVSLSVGLHLDLGEWSVHDGQWTKLYERACPTDRAAIELEAHRQLDEFRRLIGQNPTHLDSHQHVHRREPVRSIVRDMAKSLDVPVRGTCVGIRYCSDFYAQTKDGGPYSKGISRDHLEQLLRQVPPGITELSCHPAAQVDVDSMYRDERVSELGVLCDPRIRETISSEGIQLCSYGDPQVRQET